MPVRAGDYLGALLRKLSGWSENAQVLYDIEVNNQAPFCIFKLHFECHLILQRRIFQTPIPPTPPTNRKESTNFKQRHRDICAEDIFTIPTRQWREKERKKGPARLFTAMHPFRLLSCYVTCVNVLVYPASMLLCRVTTYLDTSNPSFFIIFNRSNTTTLNFDLHVERSKSRGVTGPTTAIVIQLSQLHAVILESPPNNDHVTRNYEIHPIQAQRQRVIFGDTDPNTLKLGEPIKQPWISQISKGVKVRNIRYELGEMDNALVQKRFNWNRGSITLVVP
ncbi:hypothetical protein F5146DRAFT_1003958 [Armillaria mellea]|nr:hypothetical protein F5146DRAFT_1003958 [Armillaria mellea]